MQYSCTERIGTFLLVYRRREFSLMGGELKRSSVVEIFIQILGLVIYMHSRLGIQ
jgi:hypothetical protein